MNISALLGACALLLSLPPAQAAAAAAGPASGTASASLDSRRAQLDSLIREQWEYTLRTSPERASLMGDRRYNDRWSDLSPAAVAAELRADQAFLTRFEAINVQDFPAQEKLNRDLMVRKLRLNVERARYKEWEMPLLQNSGVHLDTPQVVSALPFDTVKDYEDYIARLRKLPAMFGQVTAQMRQGVRDRLVPPQFLIPKIAEQCAAIAAMVPAASPFAEPLKKMPAGFSDADKARLNAAVLAAVQNDVIPAYKKLATFVRNDYLPHGRKEMGAWSLPNGAAYYAYKARVATTTDMAPEQIHQLGLAEVARIEGQMLAVAQKLGFADLKTFRASLETNPALHPTSRQQILDLYEQYTAQMYAQLPQQFGVLPKAKMEIRAVEAFREHGAAAASYRRGTADGSRPGRVMVNTSEFAKRNTVSIETTALHEGVPGHHMQIAIAQEIQGLPTFRTQGGFTAYSEGWALYSERLGQELGFFSDPYNYYGHLQDEMLRAIRLVVDTGLHYKKWNRQQVVDYFHDHSGFDEVEVQSETDRYIVWPGQALGYKIGQLKILELRDYARRELGAKFDIRRFHDAVLGSGALPMDVLETNIKTWVAAEKS